MEKKQVHKRYSKEFKRLVVEEYLAGNSTKQAIREKYDIQGYSVIIKWLRLFNLEDRKTFTDQTSYDYYQMKEKKKSKSISKPTSSKSKKSLEQENEDLKIQLEYYKGVISKAESELNIKIEKK